MAIAPQELMDFALLNKGVTISCMRGKDQVEGLLLILDDIQVNKTPNYVFHLSGNAPATAILSEEAFGQLWNARRETSAGGSFSFSPVTTSVETKTSSQSQQKNVTNEARDMMRNLAALSAVAEAILPDLRDMQPNERKNLQQYYKKIYRKV